MKKVPKKATTAKESAVVEEKVEAPKVSKAPKSGVAFLFNK